MARHLHLHRAHLQGFQPYLNEAPLSDNYLTGNIKDVLRYPLAQTKTLLVRTPPDVGGGGSSDSGSSDSDSGSDSSSSSDSSSDSSSSNTSGSDPSKHSPNISLPVALGVIIPVVLAIVIFVYLHRRHVRKLRQEDANDPHKSLDFGWDPTENANKKKRGRSKKGKPGVETTEIGLEKGSRRDRGMSMDLDVGSPYLLPPGLQGSRESLHSMSRTIHSQDDRYRPATTRGPGDEESLRSFRTKRGVDESSSHTGSNSLHRTRRDDMKQDLLGNAQRMSSSAPPNDRNPIPDIQLPEPSQEIQRKPLPSEPTLPKNGGLMPAASINDTRESYQPSEHLRKSNNYLGAFIHSRDPSVDTRSPETEHSEYMTPKEAPYSPSSPPLHSETPLMSSNPATPSHESPRPPRQQSLRSSQHASIERAISDDGSRYGDAVKITPASPRSSQQDFQSNNRGSSQEYMPPIDEYSLGVDESDFGYDVRRLSMGVRPLPPEDPTDNPEQRANRIRSFYKEYFDELKQQDFAPAEYYEDYDENYLGDGAIYDPVTGDFVTTAPMGYDEPYGRRAMTPPARIGGRRHAATMSGGSHLMPPGPRAFSSVSGRYGPGPRRPPPKKKLPPPKDLRVLPTPHMIREDAFASPIDFAPPTGAREQRAGMPQSPRGGPRPYSPAVRSHTPLAKSYDDLAVMPSPHLLRRSGTFTALDFAPPPRFKNSDTASDAGSIRSNRSGMSARTQYAVRTGAYRVSRIPKEVVGTKGDLMSSLKPQWNMHNNTGTIGMTNQ